MKQNGFYKFFPFDSVLPAARSFDLMWYVETESRRKEVVYDKQPSSVSKES